MLLSLWCWVILPKNKGCLYICLKLCVSFSFKKNFLYIDFVHCLLLSLFLSILSFFVANTNGVSLCLYLLIIVCKRVIYFFLTLYPVTLWNYYTACFCHRVSWVFYTYINIYINKSSNRTEKITFSFFTFVFS